MKKTINIKDFEVARNYMEELVVESMHNMELGIYDPWLKYLFENEVKSLINSQFKKKYPDTSVDFNFTIYLSAQTIEYSVQRFYHPFSQHIFLGSIRDPKRGKGKSKPFLVDCYYSKLYEPFGEPRILVRYGHVKKEMEEGATSAAEQYYKGFDTMLAKGYQLALESGYAKG